MKLIRLLLFLLLFTHKAFAQDSPWVKKEIHGLLSLNLPSNFDSSQISYLKEYNGQIGNNIYSFRYYDTSMKVKDEKDFEISLIGYADGFLQDPGLKGYRATINDTSIGGMKGLLIKLNTKDSLESFARIYCFVTIANHRFYSFNALSPDIKENNADILLFFRSIVFDPKKVKESSYSINFRYPN